MEREPRGAAPGCAPQHRPHEALGLARPAAGHRGAQPGALARGRAFAVRTGGATRARAYLAFGVRRRQGIQAVFAERKRPSRSALLSCPPWLLIWKGL